MLFANALGVGIRRILVCEVTYESVSQIIPCLHEVPVEFLLLMKPAKDAAVWVSRDALQDTRAGGGIWNDVPEWLSVLSLGRGDDQEGLLPGRPLRKPTEGGIETHITAHASGVPEITAVTCAVLGDSLKRPMQFTTNESPAAHDVSLAASPDTTEVAGDSWEEEGRGADVGSLCKELRSAFGCLPVAPPAPLSLLSQQSSEGVESSSIGQQGSIVVAAASHLADGLYGAVGELDAFDASLLPPVLTDRTSSAAVSFLVNEAADLTAVTTEEAKAPLFRPGLTGGFPVSLPTYADDYKQHWRLATRAAEAFAPPGCACCTAGCSAESKNPTAEGGTEAPAREGEPICNPVHPSAAFARAQGNLSGTARSLEALQELTPAQGPIEILVRHLKAARIPRFPCGSVGIADKDCSMPHRLLGAVAELARVALNVQVHSLLPLLPTPPLPLAANRLHETTLKELTREQTIATYGTAADARDAGTTPTTPEDAGVAEQDWTVCTSLTLCTAWILSTVLKGGADGVAVPDLLLELSNEADAPFPETIRNDLRDAARLSFTSAACKLASTNSTGDLLGEATGVPTGRPTRGAPRDLDGAVWTEDVLRHRNCSTAALACQLFLVAVSLVCWLRLVVPVPAGAGWRIVSAAEAASRFCLKEQRILRDSVAALWASHKGAEETYLHGGRQTHCGALYTPHASVGGCGHRGAIHYQWPSSAGARTFRPAMVPRAIWATWGPRASCRHCKRRIEGEAQLSTPDTDADSPAHGEGQAEGTAFSVYRASEAGQDADRRALNVCEFLSALLTWEHATPGNSSSIGEAPRRAGTPEPAQPSSCESSAALGSCVMPMKLSCELLPACAWMRLDGRLHASLVQLLCLRLWGLLVQRPGSTAQQLQGMLCLLDDCEVQLLLHALAEEGVVSAAVLWGPSAASRSQKADTVRGSGRSLCLPAAHDTLSSDLMPRHDVGQHEDTHGGCRVTSNSGSTVGNPEREESTALHAAYTALSAAEYALRVQTIYLPNAVADVLPKFQPLLLPKLKRCDCGCSVLL